MKEMEKRSGGRKKIEFSKTWKAGAETANYIQEKYWREV